MAADTCRSYAAHVCHLCKARKKRCDKQLPRCSYCAKGGHHCVYELPARPRISPSAVQSPQQQQQQQQQQRPLPLPPYAAAPASTFSPAFAVYGGVSASAAHLHQQVHQLIRASGRFVDDVTAGYFHGFHLYLPIISRPRFSDGLLPLGPSPSADLSLLLLAIHLVTLSPAVPDPEQPPSAAASPHDDVDVDGGGSHVAGDHQSLYLTTKSLFAQVQGSCSPSVHLIQAGLLVAFYEYMRGQSDQAFVTVSLCARLGYMAGIHRAAGGAEALGYGSTQAERREAANTWWGILIYERSFQCETSVPNQPLITSLPAAEAELPAEAPALDLNEADSLGAGAQGLGQQLRQPPPTSLSSACLSSLEHPRVGAFGRSAQASWLLDQVLQGSEVSDPGARLSCLHGLDEKLRVFLSELVQQANGRRGAVCQAIALTIRALYTLHGRVLDHLARLPASGDSTMQANHHLSHAALRTTTNIVIDVVEAHRSSESALSLAPSYPYMVRAALKYVNKSQAYGGDGNGSLLQAAHRLRYSMKCQTSLDFFESVSPRVEAD